MGSGMYYFGENYAPNTFSHYSKLLKGNGSKIYIRGEKASVVNEGNGVYQIDYELILVSEKLVRGYYHG
jgi:hypothetical protein